MRLPRPFIPGIHGDIPIAMYVDGGSPVVYNTPTPISGQEEQVQEDQSTEQEGETSTSEG